VPLTAAEADETGLSELSNWTVRFTQFRAGASNSYSFHVRTVGNENLAHLMCEQ
jgi:hypothetical protein